MSRSCYLVTLVGLLTLTGPIWAQTSSPQQPEAMPKPTPAPAPASGPATPESFLPATLVSPPGVMGTNGPVTMRLDPCTNFPPSGPPVSLFSPFEFYVRSGAALNTGRGSFSDVLRTGVGVDSGFRSFLFNDTQTSAWYGDLGMGYLYNESKHESVPFPRQEIIPVSRLGQTMGLPGTTNLGLRELHRTNARLALGKEYYFMSSSWDGLRYSVGGDIGGVWGNATIKSIVISRDIPDLQAGDVVLGTTRDTHSSDVNKGFFFGTTFDVIVPCRYYDFVVGSRIEWERDYFKIVDNGVGSSQLKLYLQIGWRF
jgi:hypothetical protein